MKKIFDSPEIEIIFLGVQDDIITTSDGTEEEIKQPGGNGAGANELEEW